MGKRPRPTAMGLTIVVLASLPASREEALHVLQDMEEWINDARKYLDELGGGIGLFGEPNVYHPETFFGPDYPGTGVEN